LASILKLSYIYNIYSSITGFAVLPEGEGIQLEALAAYIDYDGMRSIIVIKLAMVEATND
jgi:hypothetical protein